MNYINFTELYKVIHRHYKEEIFGSEIIADCLNDLKFENNMIFSITLEEVQLKDPIDILVNRLNTTKIVAKTDKVDDFTTAKYIGRLDIKLSEISLYSLSILLAHIMMIGETYTFYHDGDSLHINQTYRKMTRRTTYQPLIKNGGV